jgi:uncharacterized membrane protein
MTIANLLRWIHVIAGAAWLGEVAVVCFLLVPILAHLDKDKRTWFLAAVFPRVFRLASVLSLTTILAGAALNLSLNGWRVDVAFARLTSTRWGWSILVGGFLGLSLTFFHHVLEHRFEPHVLGTHDDPDDAEFAVIVRRLQIIPRVGLGVLVLTFLLMMFAVRGL